MNVARRIKRLPASPLPVILACLALALTCSGCNRASEAHVPAKKQPNVDTRLNDADRDGIPDGAELHSYSDRDHFRKWFTGIAEMQFYEISKAWNEEQRDCSGLVRFAWREALRRHNKEWISRMGPGYESLSEDVTAYNLETGLLKEKLFRTDDGAFKSADISDGSFSEFADARTLKSFNTTFVGRDRRDAKPGDLLFYYQPWVQKYPYHVMIYVGQAREAGEGADDWVVYHTGASPVDKGTVKKVRLGVLDHHPDPRWRPIENNRNFIGFHRLKILN